MFQTEQQRRVRVTNYLTEESTLATSHTPCCNDGPCVYLVFPAAGGQREELQVPTPLLTDAGHVTHEEAVHSGAVSGEGGPQS